MRLKGRGIGRITPKENGFECDEIVLELTHGRTMTIRRDSLAGEDGIDISVGTNRDANKNVRIVISPNGLGSVHFSVATVRAS